MAYPEWLIKLMQKGFPRSPMHGIWSNLPPLGLILERIFLKGDEIICLPKDKVVALDRAVEQPENMVLPSQVVKHFIDEANYHWIMDFCVCRDSLHCKTYGTGYGCLFLGRAAMDINPNYGRKVTREEAHAYADKCREAGLVHMLGKTKMDSMWLDVRPSEQMMTICNCCPCCCISRLAAYASPRLKDKFIRMPGVIVSVNDNCVGCGACAQKGFCFVNAITMEKGRACISLECRGCGRCAEICPQHAIEVTMDQLHSVKTTIDRISRLVDIK